MVMSWFGFKKGGSAKIIFSIDETHLYMCVVLANKVIALDNRELASVTEEHLLTALNELSNQHKLVGYKTHLILPEEQYQLLMTDKLNTDEKEMAKALRWKLKDLFEFPVNQTVLEVFPVPSHVAPEQQQKVYVVAANKSFLEMCVEAFNQALMPLKQIDITLFSLRNMIAAAENKKGTKIILSFSGTQYALTIYNDGNIYLARKLNLIGGMGVGTSNQAFFEQLMLEIQRSTDYCLSELKLTEPKEIMLSPFFLGQKELLTYLQQNLAQTITCIDLNEILEMEIPLAFEEQVQYQDCLGAALTMDTQPKKENV